jgi:drug/metabolite transporter (DMT)-like permease
MHNTQAHIRIFPRADRYLLAITLIWGSTFSVTKSILPDISPAWLQGLRFVFAAIMVGIYTRRDIRATTRRSLRAGLLLGVLLGVGFALQTIGQVQTTASKAAFLTGTMVIFTPILQLAIERKPPTIGNIVGVILVGIGMYLLTSPGGSAFSFGDLLVLLCAVVYAVYIVYLDVFTKERFDPEIVFWQFLACAAIGFCCIPLLPRHENHFTQPVIAGVAYLSVFATVIAIFVQAKFQRETTPTKAAIIFTMEPVIAAVIAYFALGEVMTPVGLIGAGVMIAGLLASELTTALRAGKDVRAT